MKTKILLVTILMYLFTGVVWSQKKTYRLSDLPGMCYMHLDANTTVEGYQKWLFKDFNAENGETENNQYKCYNLPDLPKGITTRFLIMKGRIGLETPYENLADREKVIDEYEIGLTQLQSSGVLRKDGQGFVLIGVDKRWDVMAVDDFMARKYRLLFQER
jgi:hypothetical protein